MADRYFVGGGTGNWNSTTNWSATSGGGSGASFPVAGDNVFLNAASGANTITVNVTSACTVLDGTGFTGTLANGTASLSVAGSITVPSGMTWTGTTGILQMTAAGTLTGGTSSAPNVQFSGTGAKTLTSAGTTWGTISTVTGAMTITLTAALACDTLASITNFGSTTFAGSFNITCNTLNFGHNAAGLFLTFVSGTTVTVNTALYCYSPASGANTIRSTTASASVTFTFSGTAANCKVFAMAFTDIDASGGTAIDNWHGSTLTRTSGITNRTSADIGGGGGGAWLYRSIGGGV